MCLRRVLLVAFAITAILVAAQTTPIISVSTVTATTETVFYSTIYNTVIVTISSTTSTPAAPPLAVVSSSSSSSSPPSATSPLGIKTFTLTGGSYTLVVTQTSTPPGAASPSTGANSPTITSYSASTVSVYEPPLMTTTYTVTGGNYTSVLTQTYAPFAGAGSAGAGPSSFWGLIFAGLTLLLRI